MESSSGLITIVMMTLLLLRTVINFILLCAVDVVNANGSGESEVTRAIKLVHGGIGDLSLRYLLYVNGFINYYSVLKLVRK